MWRSHLLLILCVACSGESSVDPPTGESPVGAAAALTIHYSGDAAQAVAVSCADGTSTRATFKGGVATIGGLPTDGCTISFRGGAPGSFGPVGGGVALRCDIVQPTLAWRCVDAAAPAADHQRGAPRAGERGLLTVNYSGDAAQAVALSCPDGSRQRAAFVGGAATFDDVPANDCTISFRGGAPGSFGPVGGGQSVSCVFDEGSGTYSCQ